MYPSKDRAFFVDQERAIFPKRSILYDSPNSLKKLLKHAFVYGSATFFFLNAVGNYLDQYKTFILLKLF